jgi:CelD/BcsL family acetyltransferase involved in cellulose biosynthesis
VLSVHVTERLDELDSVLAAWDALAVKQHRPVLRPDWLLAWWRAWSREGLSEGGLRIVLVRDARGLAGVAPMFIEDVRAKVPHLRFLGAPTFYGVSPLVRFDVADDTTRALARAITSIRPQPSVLSFELIDVAARWPDALAREWPERGTWIRSGRSTTSVSVDLGGTFEDWVHTRGRKWRSDYWRHRRRFAEIGGVICRARNAEDVSRGLGELIRLHDGRRDHSSEWVSPVLSSTLREVGPRLVTENGFRLWTVEIEGEIIGATAFVAAGRAVTTLFTGFDPAWGRFAPGLNSMVAGIEEGFRLREECVDLGYGNYPYKLKLANDARPISSYEMFPRHARYPLVRAHELPRHTRESLIRARVRLAARARLRSAQEWFAAKSRHLGSP